MTIADSNGQLDLDAPVSPVKKRKGDCLLKFNIRDFLPSHDPLAVHVARLMAVDEDLSNIERLREILEADRPTAEADEISRTKWNMIRLFLTRMRLGFLSNAWTDIFVKEKRNVPCLKELIAGRSKKVQDAYKEVCEVAAKSPRAKNVIRGFRNQGAFHYNFPDFKKGLEVLTDDMGETIVNAERKDLHFIVAYQILDVIPAGRLSSEVVQQLMKEIEIIQGKLHAFIVTLADEFVFYPAVKDRTTQEESNREN